MPSVNVTILSSDALKAAVTQVNATPNPGKPDPPSAHWMQVVLRNATQFALVPTGEYFDTGSMKIKPPVIGAFSVGQFVTQSDGKGSTGGASFVNLLDASPVCLPIAVGFTDPIIGAYTGAVVIGNDAKEGYDASNDKGTKSLNSGQFTGKSDTGSAVNFQFHLSAEVSNNCVVVSITQTA